MFIRVIKFALPIAALLLAAVAVPLKVFDANGVDRISRLRQEIDELKEGNKVIRRENESLRNQIRLFHADPRYVEKVARDELGMVAPDEMVFQFPDGENTEQPNF